MNFSLFARACALLFVLVPLLARAESPREVIARAVIAEDAEEQSKLVSSLIGSGDENIRPLLTAWKESSIYIYEQKLGEGDDAKTTRVAVLLDEKQDAEGGQTLRRVSDGQTLKNAKGAPVIVQAGDLTAADTDSNLRTVMKNVLDLADLASTDPATRRNAAAKLGRSQDPANLPLLLQRAATEHDSSVHAAYREAIDLVQLKSEDEATRISAAHDLADIGSIPSQDFIAQVLKEAPPGSKLALAAQDALARIHRHTEWVNLYGTVFRGASLGSVLLVMAIGLAITFGVMGVINMAHGELIAVGAYTTYVMEHIFGGGLALSPFGISISFPGMHNTGAAYEAYFIFALPMSFLVAALVGIALERGIIRFLYGRPLESLLATWGVSLVLQQLLRLTFGANNVQVDEPAWLSGNWNVFDVILGWNRVFVIGFAALIVFGTYLLLTRTALGLLIRAVMQNRTMAANMGVRTERVNMLTFGLGSGLAGLAGAFYSQIGNVGPSMGQDHIVNAFMTVVVGGVGSLAGTVISAVGIGVADQTLQQVLESPVMGKIIVLVAIILFLQWRPSGLFVTRTRSLEG